MLEVCIDDVSGLDAAVAGGADRLELCAALGLGGLSPAPSLLRAAAGTPAHMLIRPRAGDFIYSAREAWMMAADMDAAAQIGLAGVAIGALTADRDLDAALLADLASHARALGIARGQALALTLHRAFDLCRDLPGALEHAIALGFDCVLTSGGAPTAPAGIAMLAALHRRAGGRIGILAGSGIDAGTVAPILAAGIREIHASCSVVLPAGGPDGDEHRFGFAVARRRTEGALVKALKAEMTRTALPT